jgi:hypothetical protein
MGKAHDSRFSLPVFAMAEKFILLGVSPILIYSDNTVALLSTFRETLTQ